MKPEIDGAQDELVYTWADLNVRLTLLGIRPPTSAGMVHCLLKAGLVDVPGGNGGSIWGNWVSLTTETYRKGLVEHLQRAVPRPQGDWLADVDRALLDAYERQLTVPEPVVLADVQASPEPSYLYRPVVPDGQVALLLADQQSTKSFLMLYLALCAALDRPTALGAPERSGPSIYFDWEVDAQVAARRAAWICRGLGVPVPRHLHYVNMSHRGRLVDHARDMRKQIARIKPVLCVIDSLTFATGGDLNSSEFAAPMMSAIGGLGDGVSKLVATHPSKASRRASEDDDVSVIGSGLFEYRARAIWHMKAPPRAGRGDSFVVGMIDRKLSEASRAETLYYRISFEQRAVRFEPSSEAEYAGEQHDQPSGPSRVLDFLNSRQYQTDNTQSIARALRVSDANVRSWTRRLKERGLIEKIGGDDGSTAVWHVVGPQNGHLTP